MQLPARLTQIFQRKSAQPPVIDVNKLLVPTLEQHDDGTLTIAGTNIQADMETHPSGLTVMTMRPPEDDAHVLKIGTFNTSYDESYQRSVLQRLVEDWGFGFPNAMPFVEKYRTGFVFDEDPDDFDLPQGWTIAPIPDREAMDLSYLLDDRGRRRGFYESPSFIRGHFNGPELRFFPRISFESHIVASHHWSKQINEYTTSGGVYPYFMPSVRMEGQDVLPCFAYAHPAMWPIEDCDFTRINREYDKIGEAERFIAQETRKMFAGAYINCGTDYVMVGDRHGALRMGIPLDGDIFAHWDDGVEGQMAELRAILESRVPQILGADNSLVLCTFPTPEKIAEIQANVPFYNPPPSKLWQKPVLAGMKAIHRLRHGG